MPQDDRDFSQEYRARRRAAARTHHPDVGGDAESLSAALAAIDREFGQARRIPTSTANIVAAQSIRTRLRRAVRVATKQAKRVGRRRYFEI